MLITTVWMAIPTMRMMTTACTAWLSDKSVTATYAVAVSPAMKTLMATMAMSADSRLRSRTLVRAGEPWRSRTTRSHMAA